MTIFYKDRASQKTLKEEVYFEGAIRFLYRNNLLCRTLLFLICRFSFCSYLFGKLQRLPSSKKKIRPFVENFHVDPSEFEKPLEAFTSFNDFFIRELKKEARPLSLAKALIPADGKYLVFDSLDAGTPFFIKKEWLNIDLLLKDDPKATLFQNGASCVLARLTPKDCHRYYFPVSGAPSAPSLIKGPLYSVSPIATRTQPSIFSQNKRTLVHIDSPLFGTVSMITIGATNVGSIHETFQPNQFYEKGDEKGYFSFGGSSIILLFEKGRIQFDEDLIKASKEGLETQCLIGQSLGNSV